MVDSSVSSDIACAGGVSRRPRQLRPLSSSSLLLCLLWAAAAATSAVRDIHVAEFERVTGRDGGWWLIELYAPWCGHCRALEPTWVDIAAHLEGRMRVARVDASGGTQGMPVRADGFPTIVLYRCVWWVGVCPCVRACVRACACVCVRVCACVLLVERLCPCM